MTLSKLSLRNARRQAEDYLVYFVTIVMVAALMYAFNGLLFSKEIRELASQIAQLSMMIVMASIAVVCIISWLVSYTTHFMLTRRSKELGIYILTGFENRQVARLFFLENLVVGGFALVPGLLLGNLIYQFLRAIVLALFGIPYHISFSFSVKAVALTLLYFIVIYLSAQRKSRKRIEKMKIYDLIYFERQNEEAFIKKSAGRRSIFTVSIVLGVIGTLFIMARGQLFQVLDTICIIVFLYGFFSSFASGVPAWFEKHKAKKYQGQNLLIFRTLTAKVSTMGVTMATIALLFTATMIAEGCGMTFRAMFVNRTAPLACFDLIVSLKKTDTDVDLYKNDKKWSESGDIIPNTTDYLRKLIPTADDREYDVYLGESDTVLKAIEEHMEYYRMYPADTLMRASDYASLREMLGYPPVSLLPDQYLIHCQPYVAQALKDWSDPVTAGGHTLTFGGIHTETLAQHYWNVNGRGYILIVPDAAAEACAVSHHMYAAKTREPVSEEQHRSLETMRDRISGNYDVTLFVRSAAEKETASMTAMTVFPLYYLALVLTMTAATILTVQVLSEAERYRRQFTLLGKLGMDRREMKRALRRQFLIYYGMPAVPPLLIGVPFILNMGYMVEPGTMVGSGSPPVIAGTAAALFAVIYALYILIAYESLRKNVLGEGRRFF